MRNTLVCSLALSLITAAVPQIHADTGIQQLWFKAHDAELLDGSSNPVPVFGSNQNRSLAYNPVTDHLLVANNTGQIYILDAADGSYVGKIAMDGVGGGTFIVNQVDVADDGVIYACNLVTDASTGGFKIYRWANESAFAFDPDTFTQIGGFVGNPDPASSNRFGDTFRVAGAGVNTRIMVASRNGNVLGYFTTTDGLNFTAQPITSDASGGDMGLGLAFGAGDDIWTKSASRNLRRQTLNVAGGSAATQNNIPNTVVPNNVAPIGVNVSSNILAGVLTGTSTTEGSHALNLYDISNPAAPALIVSTNFPAPISSNGNVAGAVDFHEDLLFALDTNNGIRAFRLVSVAPPPPAFSSQQGDVSVYEGGRVTLRTSATGGRPLSYQWYFNDNAIEGATSTAYEIAVVNAGYQGNYKVTVSNVTDSITSTNAALTVLPSVLTDAAAPLWTVAPGSVAHVTSSGDTQRGMGYNPATGNLLLVSRAGSTTAHVLDGNDGTTLRQLDTTGVTGGTYTLNMIGAADDGAVYACNLVLSGAIKVYRWASDAGGQAPTVSFDGNPDAFSSTRYGDTLAVRGSGLNTQILLGSRNSTNFSILTTADGTTFTSKTITTDAPAGAFGLGVAFGAGDTIWAKSAGFGLRQVAFDLGNGVGTVISFFDVGEVPGATTTVGVWPDFGVLGTLSIEVSDHLRLYDIWNAPGSLKLLDQDFFPTDNSNINGTGSVVFGGGKVFVLDTNNGILAYDLGPVLRLMGTAGPNFELKWSEGTLQSSSTVDSGYQNVDGATSPRTVTPAATGNEFFRVQ